jgi:hypothetical protein
VEEFFYQLKGDMVLKIVENGTFYEVPIREGEFSSCLAMCPIPRNRPQKARSAWWWKRRGRTNSMRSSGIVSNARQGFTASK